MKPFVSILIPVYNREQYISDCINSALNQTYTDIEIVIVDNASTDSTWNICQNFSKRDARVKVFQNKTNIGPVLNWKRCAELAQGYYSKILFSDDALDKTAVEKLVSSMTNDVSFTYANAKIGPNWENSEEKYMNHQSLIKPNKYYKLLIEENAPLSPCAMMFRTKDLNENIKASIPTKQSHDYSMHGAGPDILISLLISKHYNYIHHINEPLVLFRNHSGSISVLNTDNEVIDSYRSVLSYFFESRSTLLKYMYLSKIYLIETIKHKRYLPMFKYLGQYSNVTPISLLILSIFIIGRIVGSLTKRVL